MKQQTRGISLIVLVITIIVMIILAGAIIISLTNGNVINKAKEAVDKTKFQTIKDAASLACADYIINGEIEKLSTYVKNHLILNNILTEDSAKEYAFLNSGEVIRLSDITLKNTSYYTITSNTFNLTTAGKDAIASGEITMIAIPNGIQTIAPGAFYNCAKLKIVILPDGLTTIREAAFVRSGITELEIPSTVTTLTSAIFFTGYHYAVYGAFENCDNITEIVIPQSITTIPQYTFNECNELNSVTLPNNLTSISSNVFRNCNKLATINISSSLTNIGLSAFYNTNIIGNIKTQLLAISSTCFSSSSTKSIDYH